MKAIVLKDFGDAENMQYSDVDVPSWGENQVLISVSATSVNRPDIVQRQGNYHPPKGESEILGLEVAGVVESVGAKVTKWQQGDRVMALVGGGGYAEFAVAHEDHTMTIPDNISFHQGACVCETYITAYLNLFLIGQLSNQSAALLHGGGGGVNTAAIQICRNLVPDTTLFVTASETKIDRVAALGANHVINYKTQSFVDIVKSETNGKGVEVILDHIGAKYLSDNMKALSVEGRLLSIGVTSGIKAELNLATMMVKRQRIIGSVLRSRSIAEKSKIIESFTKAVVPLLANESIAPLVDAVLPLSEAGQAHKMMEQSQHFGKIVLDVG